MESLDRSGNSCTNKQLLLKWVGGGGNGVASFVHLLVEDRNLASLQFF